MARRSKPATEPEITRRPAPPPGPRVPLPIPEPVVRELITALLDFCAELGLPEPAMTFLQGGSIGCPVIPLTYSPNFLLNARAAFEKRVKDRKSIPWLLWSTTGSYTIEWRPWPVDEPSWPRKRGERPHPRRPRGRPRKLSEEQRRTMLDLGLTVNERAKRAGVHPRTVTRIQKERRGLSSEK